MTSIESRLHVELRRQSASRSSATISPDFALRFQHREVVGGILDLEHRDERAAVPARVRTPCRPTRNGKMWSKAAGTSMSCAGAVRAELQREDTHLEEAHSSAIAA